MTATIDPAQARDDAGVTEERVCRTCRYCSPLKAGSPEAACMLNPPTVRIVTMSLSTSLKPDLTREVQQVPANVRPTVQPGDTCSFHRFDDELDNAEMIATELANIARWLREAVTNKK